MPRNSQGLYSLPAGNPVYPGTLIEAVWANSTLDDVANSLTLSLPRDGAAPMTGPLTLVASDPTQPRHATSKSYVDKFIAYSAGMPVSTVIPLAGNIVPAGFLLCDGQAVQRSVYPDLFTAIGTIYGAGDGTTTFNVPNLQGLFIRGRDPASRAIGSRQDHTVGTHTHPVSDPTHGHTVSDPKHTHQVPHTHSVYDPGHQHIVDIRATPEGAVYAYPLASRYLSEANQATRVAYTGIGIYEAAPWSTATATSISIAKSGTGITVGATGGTETVPSNIAMDYYIKAVNAGATVDYVQSISSDDLDVISVDSTDPTAPILEVHSNQAFGLAKLDAAGKLPIDILPSETSPLLGLFDASGGQNPSEKYPTLTFYNGDRYIVEVPGTITLYDSGTNTEGSVAVQIGWTLIWLTNVPTAGWYYVEVAAATQAINVGFTPAGTIAASNVQAAIEELGTEKIQTGTAVPQTSATGAASLPAGTTAQRPSPVVGMIRYNSELATLEWYTGSEWAPVQGPAVITGRKNYLFNHNFQVWQRAYPLGLGAASYYGDRWLYTNNDVFAANFSISRGETSDDPGLALYTYSPYYLILSTTGDTAGIFTQRLENVRTLAGRTVTLSFLQSVTTGVAATTPKLIQRFGTGGTPSAAVSIEPISSSSVPFGAMEVKTFTYNVPNINGKVFGTDENDNLEIRRIFQGEFSNLQWFDTQLEEGSEFTGFEFRPYVEDLAACQRYYQYIEALSQQGAVVTGNPLLTNRMLATRMRAVPTATFTVTGGTGVSVGATRGVVSFWGTPSATGYLGISDVRLAAEI